MSFVIPDPRWEEPALLQPGLKPTGPVEIEPSFLQNMVFGWSVGIKEVVTGVSAIAQSGAIVSGRALVTDGVNDYVEFVHPNGGSYSPTAYPVSFMFSFKLVSSPSSTSSIFYMGTSAAYEGLFSTINASNELSLFIGDGGGVNQADYRQFKVTSALTVGRTYTIAGTITDSTSAVIYIDGNEAAHTTNGTGGDPAGAYDRARIGRYPPVSVRYLNIELYAAYVWEATNYTAKAQSLTRDPYQFLIPA